MRAISEHIGPHDPLLNGGRSSLNKNSPPRSGAIENMLARPKEQPKTITARFAALPVAATGRLGTPTRSHSPTGSGRSHVSLCPIGRLITPAAQFPDAAT